MTTKATDFHSGISQPAERATNLSILTQFWIGDNNKEQNFPSVMQV